jgi:uncharacterized repeat protein (TIGR01451 family)
VAFEIIVRNLGAATATAVRVEQILPAGGRLLHAEPPAEVQKDRAVWNLDRLDAGAERRLKVEIQSGDQGELLLAPTATFTAAPLRTKFVQPSFALTVTGPQSVPRGSKFTFVMQVANHGSTPLHNVEVSDQLPEGLEFPEGSHIEADVGTLAPGETKTIRLPGVTAARPGRWVNETSAAADGGLQAHGRAVVAVVEPAPELAVRLVGPRQAAPGNDIDVMLEVANTGTSQAAGVRVTQSVPREVDLLDSGKGGTVDSANGTVSWSLPALEAGQKQTFGLKLRGRAPGDWTLGASVTAERAAEAKATFGLRIGVATPPPTLRLELIAHHDEVVLTDGETTYEIHAVNEGNTPGSNVRLTVRLPNGLQAIDAKGPSAGRSAAGGVVFDPLQLPLRADAVYRVRVRGRQPGDWRCQVELAADGLSRPLVEAVNTRVTGAFEDARHILGVDR